MKRNICVSILFLLFSIFFVATGVTSACIDPPNDMVAWWPGDGNSDEIIGQRDGGWVYGEAYEDGMVDKAFSFYGKEDFLNFPSEIEVLDTFTIDAWVLHKSFHPRITYVTIVPSRVYLQYYEGALEFYMITGPGWENEYKISYPVVLQPDVFYHIACTYDGEIMRLYLNGSEVAFGAAQGSVIEMSDFQLSEHDVPLNGLLDEVEIYNRALDYSEIQDIYAAGSEGKCKPVPSKYVIDYWHLSHRIYQDGRKLNRLSFSMRNNVTDEYLREDIVASVELYDPNGTIVPLDALTFYTENLMFGGYDVFISQWWYDEEFEFFSGNVAEVKAKLIPGQYRLIVKDTDGNEYEDYYDFYEQVDMPIISSHSFRTHRDKFGNFIWEWKVPYYLDPTLDTSVRAIILIYDKYDNWVGELYTRCPTHFGRLFVPRDVLKKILAQGKRYKLQIHIRTHDQNNRSYSKERRAKFFRKFCKDDDDYDDRDDD